MKKLTITLTFSLSFFILDAQKWQKYGENRGIESSWVDCLYFDTSMKLQVGQIYGDLIQFYENKPNFLIQESVHEIVKDKNNTYWYAILGEFLSYNSSNGFKYNTWGWPGGVSQDILSLEVDNNNNKWIGTLANGLVKYNDTPDELDSVLRFSLSGEGVLFPFLNNTLKRFLNNHNFVLP